ncbi:MAG: N-6 DNA methylase [Candidatus Lokiarchaeota archaeon]|nr:N-6 DNA methylase [Candidatus Lokiarchaeota archaeon]MBD3200633.1 N-6 DNA methylase [Candidatus Lokiarchaeota archaeon]
MTAQTEINLNDKNNSSLIKKKDLKKSNNLKSVFNEINTQLYAKLKNTDTDTRTRSKEIVNLLLCKLIDEIYKTENEILEFQICNSETKVKLAQRIKIFFMNEVKEKYKNLINKGEQINLTPELIYITVEKLQKYSLLKSSRDVFNDAFEVFVSKILKDQAGQFFTPINIVNFMVKYLNPKLGSQILDPACGHGGFLISCFELWSDKLSKELENNQKIKTYQEFELVNNLYGIDKDLFLAKISKIYLDILSGGNTNIFCEDSLIKKYYSLEIQKFIKDESFDYIFTNPPFGAKIPIEKKEVLREYELAHIWKNYQEDGWKKKDKLMKRQPPQILFIERCIQLLRNGGKLGIVLPEGIFGNPSDRYIWKFLRSKGKILGIISLDKNAFMPYTCNKTSILFFEKQNKIPEDYEIDFASVKSIGHDKDGKLCYILNKDGSYKIDEEGDKIIDDDLKDLALRLKTAQQLKSSNTHDYFKIRLSQIQNNIFIPSYYLTVEARLNNLAKAEGYEIKKIRELVEDGIIYTNKGEYIPRGNEIGSRVYGLGDIPFIRTSEISNWEVNLDSNKKTSKEVYEQYKKKQNVERGDILLVKDGGSNLIGKTAFITELDTEIIIQSHIYQIKILDNQFAIDPYLILYLLNLDIVQKQIKAITFIQGTIATIGNRIMDIKLPIPSDLEKRSNISKYIKDIIDKKIQTRKKMMNLSMDFFN